MVWIHGDGFFLMLVWLIKKNITHIFACEHMWDKYMYTLFYDLGMDAGCSKGWGGKIKSSIFVEGLTYIICTM